MKLFSRVEQALSNFKRHRPQDYFTNADLLRIKTAVDEAERETTGEIRVKVVSDLQIPDIGKNPSEADRAALEVLRAIVTRGDTRAFAEWHFYAEGLDKTREHTGVLVLLILKQRKIEIIADTGISEKTSDDVWGSIVHDLSLSFQNGNFTSGLVATVSQVGAILAEHFPIKPGDVDELSDEVILEEE